MQRGDHLVVSRGVFTHHGLYLGGQQVIHYGGGLSSREQADGVEIISLEAFANGRRVTVQPHPSATYDADARLARARARLGERQYHPLTNNCEHFVNWCIDAQARSPQVTTAITTGSLLMTPYGRAALFGLGYHVCRSVGGPVVIGGLIGYGLVRLVKNLRSSG
ncbi:lecithin retinol acyltransferase family protein [Aeromonas piscicola]|uniref:Lecithin retinol acyltransferase family protein n=1 Tax=Aeromonas piscicola TaxID=600645 RepID=A0ABT7Q9U8_9GAMM|nr:lecithin retinol acyltransferase family protein [Aeromonas piscicola]MDM5130276.1 lecithin retinol acyltransferase family protein [Aeromonas piscicola]